jgi:mycothiol system anti-sigma-R factor
MIDPCEHCEEVMQPYLDRALSAEEQASVEQHLEACPWCAPRYRFESALRGYVKIACTEPMPPDLKAKLAALRTPLL